MVPEAPLKQTEHGLVAAGVARAERARCSSAPASARGRGHVLRFEGETDLPLLGIDLVLWPGEPMFMCHWEADQEDLLVLHGEAPLIVEGERSGARGRARLSTSTAFWGR